MRAILIDPVAKTVTEVEHTDDYRDIYKHLECDLFTVVGIDEVDSVFIDDEGLLKDEPGPFFALAGYPQPLAGRGLILGCDEEGESIAARMSLDEARAMVSFPEAKFRGFEYSEGQEGDVFVIRNRAIFD
jgi:hypothetical protein